MEAVKQNPYTSRLWQRDPIGWRSQSVRLMNKYAKRYDNTKMRYNALVEDGAEDSEQAQELLDRMDRYWKYKGKMEELRSIYEAEVEWGRGENNYTQVEQGEREMTETASRFLERVGLPEE